MKIRAVILMKFLILFCLVFHAGRIYCGQADDFNNIGLANYKSGNISNAIEYYSKAIKLSPKLSPAYNNRGMHILNPAT